MSKKEWKPKCYGLFQESSKSCQFCLNKYPCYEQLIKNILEGKSKRPSIIVELNKKKLKEAGGE